jgi:hypothetical protein
MGSGTRQPLCNTHPVWTTCDWLAPDLLDQFHGQMVFERCPKAPGHLFPVFFRLVFLLAIFNEQPSSSSLYGALNKIGELKLEYSSYHKMASYHFSNAR